MLLSLIVSLRCVRGGAVPRNAGELVHAWLLGAIERVDPVTAGALHANDGGKAPQSFAVSALWSVVGVKALRATIRPGDRCELRLATVVAGMDELLVETLRACGDVRVGTLHFVIEGVTSEATQHARASYQHPGALIARWWDGAPPGHDLTVHFETPTTFRSQDRTQNLVFPTPDLVFGSLARRWEVTGHPPIEPSILDRLRLQTRVSRYELRTACIAFRRFKQIGFVGQCSYQASRTDDDAVARAMHLLADFGYYTGVGYKTSMGMGMIAPVSAAPGAER